MSDAIRIARNERARLRMAEWRKTDDYRKWLVRSRERRRKLKEKYRRQAGVSPRERKEKRDRGGVSGWEARRIEKAEFMTKFVGPPTAKQSMSAAEYYQWRIRSSPEFYVKELDRAQQYKVRVRAGYKESICKWVDMPIEVKEVKHLQYLISRQLERISNENNQSTAR